MAVTKYPIEALSSKDIIRFWSYALIAGADECWIWQGVLQAAGYGHFSLKGRTRKAHNVAKAIEDGSLPAGVVVCHKCDNPSCVNPAHLFVGTEKMNMEDKFAKGRGNNPTGDDHWSRRMPTKVHRGDDHHARQHPEKLARGSTNGNSTLTEETVKAIRSRYASGVSTRTLAEEYGVWMSTILAVVKRKTWRHIA